MKPHTMIAIGAVGILVAWFLSRNRAPSTYVANVGQSVNGYVRTLQDVENSLSGPQLFTPV